MNQNELYHHGVKGQKHGVRHGPPYPLQYGGKSLGSLPVKKKQGSSPLLEAVGKKATEMKAKSAAKRAKKEAAKIAKRAEQVRKGKVSLSNLKEEELDYLIARMSKEKNAIDAFNREQKYVNDVKESQKSVGRKMVEAQMADIGKKVVTPLITTAVSYAVYKAINRHYTKNLPENKNLDKTVEKAVEQAIKDMNIGEAGADFQKNVEKAVMAATKRVANDKSADQKATQAAKEAQKVIDWWLKNVNKS